MKVFQDEFCRAASVTTRRGLCGSGATNQVVPVTIAKALAEVLLQGHCGSGDRSRTHWPPALPGR